MTRSFALPLVFAAGLSGCSAPQLTPIGPDHPAYPDAQEAPLPSPAGALAAGKPAASSSSPTPAGHSPSAAGRQDEPEVAHQNEKPKPAAIPTGKALENVNRLPETERAAALRQAACPVSGKLLGSMGVPNSVSAGDRKLFLCCRGCESEFNADSQAILRRLGGLGSTTENGGKP